MDYVVTVELRAPAELIPLDELRRAGAGSLLADRIGEVEGMDAGEDDEHDDGPSVELDNYLVAAHPEGVLLKLFVETASLAVAEESCRDLVEQVLDAIDSLGAWTIAKCEVDLNPLIAEQLAEADVTVPDTVPDGPGDDGDDGHPATDEARLLAAALGMRGFDSEAFGGGEDDPEEDEDPAQLAMGALMIACEVLTDELFMDVHMLTKAGKDASAAALGGAWVLDDLPSRNAHLYTASFARKFLLSVTAVVDRLAGDWEPCANVAEELALRLLIGKAEAVIEIWTGRRAADFDGAFRTFEDHVFEDPDHELLYDQRFDGVTPEDLKLPGMAPTDFASWFEPFNDDRTVNPYCLPDRPNAEPDSAS